MKNKENFSFTEPANKMFDNSMNPMAESNAGGFEKTLAIERINRGNHPDEIYLSKSLRNISLLQFP